MGNDMSNGSIGPIASDRICRVGDACTSDRDITVDNKSPWSENGQYTENVKCVNINVDAGNTTELHSLIAAASRDNHWSEVINWLRSHPEEAQQCDKKFRTPLALACSVPNTPSNVIREILAVSPGAPTIPDKNGSYPLHFYATTESQHKDVNILKVLIQHHKDATLARNRFGNTPLQAAIEASSPRADILKALILANTKAVTITNNHGSYPLHYAWKDRTSDFSIVKLLLKLYPQAVSCQNDYGATPIFMAVNWDASVEVMDLLLGSCPAAAQVKDERGICSISSAWNLFVHQVKVDDEADINKEKERVKRNRKLLKLASSQYDLEGKAELWWNKMQILMKASYHNSIKDPLPNIKWRVLHAAAGCDCPPDLMSLVLKMYRNHLFLKDENKNLPIHIICAGHTYVKQPFESEFEPTISKIALEFPEGVKIKGGDGKLPLHIAVQNGKAWSEGVSRLIELYPESVRVCDKKTRLFPAMLMAESSHSKASQNKLITLAARIAKVNFKSSVWKKLASYRKEEEIKKVMNQRHVAELNTVYQLLRLAPDLITTTGDEQKIKEKAYLRSDNERQTEKFREMNYDAIALKRILLTKEREYRSKLGELERELIYLREHEKKVRLEQQVGEKRDDS